MINDTFMLGVSLIIIACAVIPLGRGINHSFHIRAPLLFQTKAIKIKGGANNYERVTFRLPEYIILMGVPPAFVSRLLLSR